MANTTHFTLFTLLCILLPLTSRSFNNATQWNFNRHNTNNHPVAPPTHPPVIPPKPCLCEQPPPPPNEPQPKEFISERVYNAYMVIQRFKLTISCDAQSITSTWSGVDVCNAYKGFYCDHPPDNTSTIALAAVDFNGYGLCAPTLVNFLDQLPDLAFFHANSCNFTGPVPDVSKFPYIYELDFSNNKFIGSFPTNVVNIPELLFLDIRYNSFSGLVPATVFQIQLDVLFLNNNDFSSPLPANLGSTTVKYLTLANNGFTGPIPPTIGNASNTLTEILLLGNKLSDCLPYEIGLLKELTLFDASINRLTGPIPYSFGCLTKLEELNLTSNFMYGMVPEVVCQLGNLQSLSLSDNYFTSVGPLCKALVDKGILDLKKNCIPGLHDQRPHEDCVGFQAGAYHCPLHSTLYYMPCKPNYWHGISSGKATASATAGVNDVNGRRGALVDGDVTLWKRVGKGSRVYDALVRDSHQVLSGN